MINIENDIGLLVSRLAKKLSRIPDAYLEKQGLTGVQARILHYIDMHDGKARQRDIESWSDKSHPTVNGIISRLQDNGFVEVQIDPEDHRQRLILLTSKARKLNSEIALTLQKTNEQLISQLDESELGVLKSALNKMYLSLKKEDSSYD